MKQASNVLYADKFDPEHLSLDYTRRFYENVQRYVKARLLNGGFVLRARSMRQSPEMYGLAPSLKAEVKLTRHTKSVLGENQFVSWEGIRFHTFWGDQTLVVLIENPYDIRSYGVNLSFKSRCSLLASEALEHTICRMLDKTVLTRDDVLRCYDTASPTAFSAYKEARASYATMMGFDMLTDSWLGQSSYFESGPRAFGREPALLSLGYIKLETISDLKLEVKTK